MEPISVFDEMGTLFVDLDDIQNRSCYIQKYGQKNVAKNYREKVVVPKNYIDCNNYPPI